MFKSIPMSAIVNIVPSVLSAGGTPLALNGVMIVKGLKESGAPVREVTANDDLESIFLDDDLDAAQAYFNGITIATQRPSKLFVVVKQDEDYAATLTGAELSPWKQGEGGALSMSVVIDGVKKDVTEIDYNAAGSYSNIAEQIGTQLETVAKFDESTRKIVINSPTTGAQSTISTATGDLAEALGLTDKQGAVAVNGGVADKSITTAMDRAYNYSQNWGSITTAYSMSDDEALEFAKWVNNQDNRFWGVIWSLDPKATQDQESIGTKVIENNFSGITCVYGDARYAAAAMGYAASINFSELNGRMTLDFRTQSGLSATVTDANTASMLERNGYMFYGAYATANDRFVFFRNSKVSGPFEWVDSYLNQVYFNAQLQLAMANMLISYKAVPYNDDGKAMHFAAAQDPIDEMLNFGGIVTGVRLSEAQKNQVNYETGVDAARQIESEGYFFRVGDATAQSRANRTTMPLKLWYADGGSVHSINLASIMVQ